VNHGEHRVLHAGDVVHDDAGYLDRVAKPPIIFGSEEPRCIDWR
jgi:hypothetical protein